MTTKTKDKPLPEKKTISFANPLDMMACLSAERLRLIETVRSQRLSVSALAEELGRNRGSVTRDVQMLAGFGLVRLRRERNPAGHGILQIVTPVADRVVLQAEI